MTTEQTNDPADGSSDYQPPETEDEFNRIIAKRLERERAKFGDYDDLKAKAAKYDETEQANQSEMEKLQAAMSEKDAQLAELPQHVRKQAIRFASKATHAGFLDPEDALLNIDVDLSDDDAVDAALTELAERKPHLVRPEDPAPGPRSAQRPKPPKGEPLGSAEGDDSAKERAAAALRQFRNTA